MLSFTIILETEKIKRPIDCLNVHEYIKIDLCSSLQVAISLTALFLLSE